MFTHSNHFARLGFCAVLTLSVGFAGQSVGAQGKGPVITLRALKHAYHNAPMTIALPSGSAGRNLTHGDYLMLTPASARIGKPLRAQIGADGKTIRLSFIVDDLPMGESRSYRLGQVTFVRKPDKQVE